MIDHLNRNSNDLLAKPTSMYSKLGIKFSELLVPALLDASPLIAQLGTHCQGSPFTLHDAMIAVAAHAIFQSESLNTHCSPHLTL